MKDVSPLQFDLFIPLSAPNLVMQLPKVHQGVPLQDCAGRHDPGEHVVRHTNPIYVLPGEEQTWKRRL